MKVKEVIAALENAIPLPFPQTCDIYHIGNPEAEVQKIASVFMADVEVIRKAAAEGVNPRAYLAQRPFAAPLGRRAGLDSGRAGV